MGSNSEIRDFIKLQNSLSTLNLLHAEALMMEKVLYLEECFMKHN